jgi:hypothetical protein
MAQLGPLTITAHNGAQAEYLVRSRAEQRGVKVQGVEVADAGTGAWYVTITVDDADAEKSEAALLGEDTQVLHFRSHAPRRPTGDQ